MAKKQATEKTASGTNVTSSTEIANALRRIASGGSGGPDGLELVAMALAGDGFTRDGRSVAQGLSDVAEAINNLAAAIRESKSA